MTSNLDHASSAAPVSDTRTTDTAPLSVLRAARPVFLTDLALFALCVIWGVNFSVIKVALIEIQPLAFNALRFPLAAATLFVLLRWRGAIPMPQPGDRIRIVLLGLLGNVVYQFLFIFGIDGTLAGNASLVLATVPIWTLILSTALGQGQHTGAVWVGVLAALGGIVLVVVGGNREVDFLAGLPRGDLLLVAASVTWAVYTVGTQDLARKYGALAVTSWTLWIGTVGLVAAGAGSLAGMDLRAVSPMAWAGVAYAGVLGIAIAYLLWNYGLEHIGSSRTAAFSNLVPVVALVTAALWLGEKPTAPQLVGAVIIIGGVWLVRVAQAREVLSAG